MIQNILSDVEVQVRTQYQGLTGSLPDSNHVFSYSIKIINHSPKILQLISRKWIIFDSMNFTKVIEGIGVVGRQPIFEHQSEFNYTSATQIESELGTMKGEYIFRDLNTFEEYKVIIPEFNLIVPSKLN